MHQPADQSGPARAHEIPSLARLQIGREQCERRDREGRPPRHQNAAGDAVQEPIGGQPDEVADPGERRQSERLQRQQQGGDHQQRGHRHDEQRDADHQPAFSGRRQEPGNSEHHRTGRQQVGGEVKEQIADVQRPAGQTRKQGHDRQQRLKHRAFGQPRSLEVGVQQAMLTGAQPPVIDGRVGGIGPQQMHEAIRRREHGTQHAEIVEGKHDHPQQQREHPPPPDGHTAARDGDDTELRGVTTAR